jgi:proteasome lid subunit RPN8/RPN11
MLEIRFELWDEMIRHALAEAPNECCGFLLGTAGVPSRVLRLRNEAASPREYFADPRDLMAAERTMRETGRELVAIYHSHPTSEAKPSRRDLAENYYEDVPHIIISLVGPTPVLKAFRLAANDFVELPCARLDS